jgi:DNA topoisomerase-2
LSNKFKILDNIEKVLKRPNRALGDIALSTHNIFILSNNKISQEEVLFNPGLNKIIRETIDNSVDEYIRTNGEYANKIDINIDSKTGEITVSDNGRGLPIIEVDNLDGTKILLPEAAWCLLNAGSNFDDDSNNTTMGQNGEGVALTNIFSKQFKGETTNV